MLMFSELFNEINSAFTRLPGSWTAEMKHRRVDQVLSLLGLTDVQHTIVGDEAVRGVSFLLSLLLSLHCCFHFTVASLLFHLTQQVSGGERRRVNIGIELVTNPSILVLDGEFFIFFLYFSLILTFTIFSIMQILIFTRYTLQNLQLVWTVQHLSM